MTLITVVCYDFVIFSRSKSRIFEKSTLSPRGYFSEIPSRKINLIFLFRPFTLVLKLRDVKKFSDFCGNKRFYVGKDPTAANFDGNLINRPICKIFARSCVVYTGFKAPFYG